MQSLRKYVLFVLMAVFVASVAITPAHAQENGLVADVPFDFTVGSQHLTAGNYRVTLDGERRSFIAISQLGGRTAYSIFNQGGTPADRNGKPYLVFVRNGKDAFLTKIVMSPAQSYELPLSSREREIIAQSSTVEMVDVSTGGGGSR